jgi:hypothetical protein
MKRIFKTLALPLVGFSIVLSGLVYDALFVGIPYQDPTPELQARNDSHRSINHFWPKGEKEEGYWHDRQYEQQLRA